MVKLKQGVIKDLDFALYGYNFITLRTIKYKNITVPKGFEFDGVTVKAPFTVLFSTKDLRQGIKASCLHDWMCQHRAEYTRQYATKVLVDIWQQDGLGKFKAGIVELCVNVYQWFRGGWKECV